MLVGDCGNWCPETVAVLVGGWGFDVVGLLVLEGAVIIHAVGMIVLVIDVVGMIVLVWGCVNWCGGYFSVGWGGGIWSGGTVAVGRAVEIYVAG